MGSTCLALACSGGWMEVVELLLADPRVDPSQADASGTAPIHRAAASGNADAVHCLLWHGVSSNLTTTDSRKESALHVITRTIPLRGCHERNRKLEAMTWLLKFKANVFCPNHV